MQLGDYQNTERKNTQMLDAKLAEADQKLEQLDLVLQANGHLVKFMSISTNKWILGLATAYLALLLFLLLFG
jgi:hypothetical protein